MANYYVLDERPDHVTYCAYLLQSGKLLIVTKDELEEPALTEDELHHLCHANRLDHNHVTTRFV